MQIVPHNIETNCFINNVRTSENKISTCGNPKNDLVTQRWRKTGEDAIEFLTDRKMLKLNVQFE